MPGLFKALAALAAHMALVAAVTLFMAVVLPLALLFALLAGAPLKQLRA